MRYAFVVVSWLLPWLSGALPTRYSAKVVAAAQGIVLVVASAHLLAQQIAAALVVAALAALLWSFGKSVTWLWRARVDPVRRRPVRTNCAGGTRRGRMTTPPLDERDPSRGSDRPAACGGSPPTAPSRAFSPRSRS